MKRRHPRRRSHRHAASRRSSTPRTVGARVNIDTRAPRDDAGRPRHLEHHRIQGARRGRRITRRRRQSGRAAAIALGARHAERAEHADAERRQRQRPGGAGLRDELLRARRRSRTSRSRPARRTSPSAPAACFINMVTKSGTNRFSGSGAADLSGQADAVEQRRQRAAAGGIPAGRELDRAHQQHELPDRAARSSRTGCSSSATFNYQATHVKVPGFPAVVAAVHCLAAHRHERSGHDRHPRRRGQDHLSARTRATASRATSRSSATTSRTAAPAPTTTQDSNSKELDTFVISQLVVQLDRSASGCSSTARSATTTRTSRSTRRPTCSR